ncbi:MAG TPA: carbohydrate binding domain-containing protein, partial [Armatimonadota bacterium]|nr:carbohydrate binding domain-containing protein [Armatimonadota bacterium]
MWNVRTSLRQFIFVITLMLLGVTVQSAANNTTPQVLRTFDFEQNGLQLWVADPAEAMKLTIDNDRPHSGHTAAKCQMTGTLTRSKFIYSPYIALPALDPGETATVKVKCFVRTESIVAKRLELKMLSSTKNGLVFWDNPLPVPQKSDWTVIEGQWTYRATDRGVSIYLTADGESHGTVWIDDLSVSVEPAVTLPKADTDITSLPKEGKELTRYDFEADGTKFWVAEPTEGVILSHDKTTAHSGIASARIHYTDKITQGKIINSRFTALPKLAAGDTARLHIKFYVRTQNLKANRLQLKVLSATTLNPYFFPTVMDIPAASEWKLMEGNWTFGPNNTSIALYIASDGDTVGDVWLDDLTINIEPIEKHQFITGVSGNVFTTDNGTVTVKMVNPQQIVQGSIRLCNESGTLLQEIPAPTGSESLLVQLPHRGFYALEAFAQYTDGSKITTRSTAAVIGPVIPDQLWKQSRFGIVTVSGDPTLVAAAGGHWDWWFDGVASYRVNADGNPVPPIGSSPGIQGNNRGLLQTIYTLGGSLPNWLQPANPEKGAIYPPIDWEQYRKLICAYANTPNFPKFFNVFNEPEGKWRGTAEEFVRWHDETAKAIKSIHPETKVLGPCTCNINMPLLKRWIQLGLLNHLDGMVVHPYVDGTPPEEEFITRVIELRNYLTSIGRKDFPLYLTEFGWTTGAGGWQKPVDEITQARYVSRALTLLSTVNVDAIVYFCFSYNNINPGETGFALFNTDYTPKPGYAAYANVTRWLTGVEQGGCWLSLTPSTNLVFFPKGSKTVAVAWDTKGTSTITLPQPAQLVQDMMGATITPSTSYTISPSPKFFELADPSLARVSFLPEVSVTPGETVRLPWNKAMLPNGFQRNGRTIKVPSNISLGHYQILGKGANGWQVLPINIAAKLSLTSYDLVWPPNEKTAKLRVRVHSNIKNTTQIRACVKLDSGKVYSSPAMAVTMHNDGEVFIPLASIQNGERLCGALWCETIPPSVARTTSQRINRYLLGCPQIAPEQLKWNALPDVDFSAYSPFVDGKERVAALTTEDCSATLKTCYDAVGLHLRVRVTDDQHVQAKDPMQMWMHDSLQLAFDIDAEKEWQPNFQGFGFNGHRVFEYGIALSERGVMNWRWLAYDPMLSPNCVEQRIQASVTREGTVTLYDIVFPWPT